MIKFRILATKLIINSDIYNVIKDIYFIFDYISKNFNLKIYFFVKIQYTYIELSKSSNVKLLVYIT